MAKNEAHEATKTEKLLKDLFDTNPTKWAQADHRVTHDGNNFELFVGDMMGSFHDIVQAHKALEHVGLVDGTRKPEVGEYGITTTDGHTTLGFGDGKGGFYDKVALSNNASARAELGKGFGFEVNFGDRSEAEVEQKLQAAIDFVAANRDKKLLEEAAKELAMAASAKRDNQYEVFAKKIQTESGRTDAGDEKTVIAYIQQQLESVVPGIKVEISRPKDAFAIDHVYGVKTQERDLKIILPPAELQRFKDMPLDGPDGEFAFMGKLSDALGEKLTLTRPEFAKISGI